ncbi:MAG: adenylate/guanylate cyclase domain-containing protein [Actinomycetota bacterium]
MARYRRRRTKTLRQVLEGLGLDQETIDEAERAGTAELLAIDRLVLPEKGRYTLTELAEKVEADPEVVRVFWRSLGFVEPVEDERIFTKTDVKTLSSLGSLVQSGAVDPAVTLQMARVLGQSMAQLAAAVIDSAEIQAARSDDTDGGGGIAVRSGELLPFLSSAVDYSFRRHLRAAARRRVDLALDDEGRQVVGFADLVRFTELSLRMDDDSLATMLERFDEIVHAVVVERRGRIVKMIGDAAMFTASNADDAALIALDLMDAVAASPALEGVRVGMATGPVISRDGDLYGPTVNLASRLVGIGRGGAINVNEELRDALRGDRRFSVRTLGERSLRHIGDVPVYRLRPGTLPRDGAPA